MSFFSQISIDPTSFNSDAAANLRVSQKTSLGDYKFLKDKLPLLFDIKGTGTNTFSTNLVQLSVAAGQHVVAQSKIFHPYLAGKSQLIEMTCDNFQSQANVTKRFGYYSSNTVAPYQSSFDGIFLQNDGTTVSAEIYKSGSNVVSTPQSSWDDPLDGTGQSGMTVNWQNFNVIAIDFLYLGGTAVRFFIFYNGQFNLFYTFKYAGTAQGTMITSPNQPVRYEIVSTTGAGSFNMICSSVNTEGSLNNIGTYFSHNNGVTGFVATTVGTTYAVIGLRKLSTARDISIILQDIQVFITSANDINLITVRLNPTIAGVFTYNTVADTQAQVANGVVTNTVTGGTILLSGYNGQNTINRLNIENVLNSLGSDLDGVMDSIVICVTPATASVTTLGQVTFKQIG